MPLIPKYDAVTLGLTLAKPFVSAKQSLFVNEDQLWIQTDAKLPEKESLTLLGFGWRYFGTQDGYHFYFIQP